MQERASRSDSQVTKVSETSQYIQDPPLPGKHEGKRKIKHMWVLLQNVFCCSSSTCITQGCRCRSQQRMQISSCKVSPAQSNNAHLAALLPYVPAIHGSLQSPAMKKNLPEDATAFVRGWGQNPLLSNSSPDQDVTAAGETC